MGTEHKIANYDEAGFKYAKYWSDQVVGKAYEDLAERLAISRMIPRSGYWFLDLGAGYGRLADLYINRFDNVIICDYSIENLKKAQQKIGASQTLNTNIYYIAANAYHLPFRNDCFDAAMMIRVLAHIELPLEVLNEAYRILAPGGNFILEFSNKRHLLEILRGLLGLSSVSPFTLEPAPRGELTFNFHPEYIKRKLAEVGFAAQIYLSVSNLRNDLVKRLFNSRALMMLESPLQYLFAPARLGPSVFVGSQKPLSRLPIGIPNSLEDLLCCPACSVHPLVFHQNEISCPNCNESYIIDDEIIDLRIV